VRSKEAGAVYLSSGYFGNMESAQQAASFKVGTAISRSWPMNKSSMKRSL